MPASNYRSMKKISILVLITILTIGLVYTLVRYIRMDGFAFAWVLNFLLMFFVLAFTETLKIQLASPYYIDKRWERKGKVYESFGINYFRKLLVLIGWEKLNKKSAPVEKVLML